MTLQSLFLNICKKREFIYKPISRRYIHQNQTNKNSFDSDPDFALHSNNDWSNRMRLNICGHAVHGRTCLSQLHPYEVQLSEILTLS
jgi:hypothetical protein